MTAGLLQHLDPAQRDVLSAPSAATGFELRDDARRFETSEVSFALLAGLGNALREMNHLGIERVWERVAQTSAQIREALREIPGISLDELGTLQSGLIAFNLAGWTPSN